ncbi:hypothetical protein PIROE2DRAFT_58214 [Piromyces sp. E2]|nr:hypothetical protein PIROE2DRAFT_58214 [Piromyces sp. E2]|eukprot:OUM68233.1 hypothetical protein PIROE2DRAFT_58214 [Piromyces sp. E2]
MPKLDTIPSNWNIIPTVIGIKQNEPQIYLEYNIEDNIKGKKHRRVRIPIRALRNRENSLSSYEIAIKLSKQYSRYLEKISINQIERIVKLIQNKEVLSKKFMKINKKIDIDETNKPIEFNNNQSFVLNDDDDNIYNFSTPTRSLISLNSLQPPSFLRDNVSLSEPNISKIPSLGSNKLLGSSISLNDVLIDNKNDNQILNNLRNHEDRKELEHINSLNNYYNKDNPDIEKEDNKDNLGENDYSMNSFENDSILNSISKKELSENNKNLSVNNYNYDQSFEQDFESIEEDFEEISESELNTENDFPGEEQIENDNSIKKPEIPKAITPNESENYDDDDDIEEEVKEIVEEVKKKVEDKNDYNDSKIEMKEETEKEENFDDILISDISRNDISIKENKNTKISNDNNDIEETEALEGTIENVSTEDIKIIDEDLNKVSESELNAKKKEMDILFKKNQIKPGDPNYQYDVQKSFSVDADAEADWDDSSESLSEKNVNYENEKEISNYEKKDNNDNDNILKLVDRKTEIEKWNKININNPNKNSLTSINHIINKKNDNSSDDDESESISEDISLKSSNDGDSDFKVDPPVFINNQRNPINIINRYQENTSELSKSDNYINKIGLKEMNDEEITNGSFESDIENSISLKNDSEIKQINKTKENESNKKKSDYSKMFIHPQKKTVQDDTFSFLKMNNLSGSNVELNIDKPKKKQEDDDDDDEDKDEDEDENENENENDNSDDDDKNENNNSLKLNSIRNKKPNNEEEIEEDISIELTDQSKIENKSLNMGSLIELNDVKHQSLNEGLDSIIPNNNDNDNDNRSNIFQKTNNTFDNIPTLNKLNNDDDSDNILDLIGDTESLDSFNNEDFEFRDQDYSEDFEAGYTDENM